MPELPEVETVRRGLLPVLEGRRIALAKVNRPDLRWPLPDRMAERLNDQTVVALRRRSKYLLADLSSGETLIVHLGMSGRLLISGVQIGRFYQEQRAPDKHDHVILETGDGARVTFNDARRFGSMDLWPTALLDTHWLLDRIGPEPFGNDFNEDHMVAAFLGRNTPVKTALLDQRIVAGLGNIYVCEVLHRAGISPRRKANRIAQPRIRELVPVIRDVLSEAIEAGGSSLRDYRQADGELGYFQHAFRAYGREGEACTTAGCNGVIKRISQSGRSTFYCSNCQR